MSEAYPVSDGDARPSRGSVSVAAGFSETYVPALFDPACYPHPTGPVELIETHISWVFLAGQYAYKIKKPVRLPFLDFSNLAARRLFCNEELRLNRRTAPDLYLEVVPVTGSIAAPRIGGTGEAIEYALRMKRFSQDALADRMAKRGEIAAGQIDAMAAVIAAFHASIAAAPEASTFGDAAHVTAPALANFDEVRALVSDRDDATRLERLSTWTQAAGEQLHDVFHSRRRDGFVRECHGDLHLGNIVFLDDRPVPFDCIEFSTELRWIDVMNEVAFLAMDLLEHRLDAAAARFVNAYLEATGDYAGVRVLRYYQVYRAMVRAKVARIRARQPGVDEAARGALLSDYGRYVALAESFTAPARPAVVLMHGLAGSGKTTLALVLLERTGAIRVRSDVERKRLHGLAAQARTHALPYAGIYAPETTRRTYDRLKQVVRDIITSGHTAIVDAAFLWRADRDAFHSLADTFDMPFFIVSCRASHAELLRRVARREAVMGDASEAGVAVLENQISTEEPLGPDEQPYTVIVDTAMDETGLRSAVDGIAARLARKAADASH